MEPVVLPMWFRCAGSQNPRGNSRGPSGTIFTTSSAFLPVGPRNLPHPVFKIRKSDTGFPRLFRGSLLFNYSLSAFHAAPAVNQAPTTKGRAKSFLALVVFVVSGGDRRGNIFPFLATLSQQRPVRILSELSKQRSHSFFRQKNYSPAILAAIFCGSLESLLSNGRLFDRPPDLGPAATGEEIRKLKFRIFAHGVDIGGIAGRKTRFSRQLLPGE